MAKYNIVPALLHTVHCYVAPHSTVCYAVVIIFNVQLSTYDHIHNSS